LGLCVSNLDESIAFYQEVAGMTLRERHQRSNPNFDTLTNNRGTTTAVALLECEEFCLQLIQYVRSGGTTLDLAHNNIGSPHLCFFVDDVRAELERVHALGHETVTPDVVVLNDYMTSFYLADPDGVPVELLELTGPLPY
jgi:catechol 2,3-dioxygenase-like lactoylglutathione lyase family enzyme